MKRVAAGRSSPVFLCFEPANRPDDRAAGLQLPSPVRTLGTFYSGVGRASQPRLEANSEQRIRSLCVLFVRQILGGRHDAENFLA